MRRWGAWALRRWSVTASILITGCAGRSFNTATAPRSWKEVIPERIADHWHLRPRSISVDTGTMYPLPAADAPFATPLACASARWGCAGDPAKIPVEGRAILVVGFTLPATARLHLLPGGGADSTVEALALVAWRAVPQAMKVDALYLAFFYAEDERIWTFNADSLDRWQTRVK